MIKIDWIAYIRAHHLWYGFRYKRVTKGLWLKDKWVYYPTLSLIRPDLPKSWSRWILRMLRTYA